jgi:hypothetical protein
MDRRWLVNHEPNLPLPATSAERRDAEFQRQPWSGTPLHADLRAARNHMKSGLARVPKARAAPERQSEAVRGTEWS